MSYIMFVSSQFLKPAFGENILQFVQDKVDHMWQNYPTEFRTTYDRCFEDRHKSSLVDLERQQDLKTPVRRIFAGSQLA